jgi:hypothetical protein
MCLIEIKLSIRKNEIQEKMPYFEIFLLKFY